MSWNRTLYFASFQNTQLSNCTPAHAHTQNRWNVTMLILISTWYHRRFGSLVQEMAMHWMAMAQCAERRSAISITRTVVATNEHKMLFPILILSAYIHIGFPSSLFHSDFTTKQCTHLSPMHYTCPNPSHPPSSDHPHNIWQAVQVTNLRTWCNFPQSPPTSSL